MNSINKVYLPFTKEQLKRHFKKNPVEHIKYYLGSSQRYEAFKGNHVIHQPIGISRYPRQIEKDERFWTATALMSLYYQDPINFFGKLLTKGFGEKPPLSHFQDWGKCLTGDLKLFFEFELPAPKHYKEWLSNHIYDRHLIPYVLEAAQISERRGLEGPTQVDAILINKHADFIVLFEAKVLSDISCDITFDVMRNHVERNVDVMLQLEPHRSLFILLTPEIFRNHHHSRLYGWLLKEYQSNPTSLARDLPHRTEENWDGIAKRLAWLTWEDLERILPGACPWLQSTKII